MFDWWEDISSSIVYGSLALQKDTALGDAVHFFLYDTVKIFILLVSIIFIVGNFSFILSIAP